MAAFELALTAYYVVKHRAFAFWDIASDTFLCFYPLQVAVAQQWKQLHSITWSFDLGLGGFIGTLFDPLWLLSAWFPDDWQLGLRLPMFLLRVMLAGGFFYGYLREIGFAQRLAVLGGMAFALSSYGMINAQWEVLHGTEFVQLAAYLFLYERFWRTRSPWPAVVAGIVVGLGHPFSLYQFALLTAIYAGAVFVTRRDTSVGRYLRTLLQFGVYCLAGIALTAPLLFPAIYYFVESPRVSGDHSYASAVLSQLFTINGPGILYSEIGGLVGKDIFGTGNFYKGWGNYFEGPGFYIGLLPLILIPQLLGRAATRKERWLCIACLAGVVAYLLFPIFRYAAYGFGHSAFRLSTFWISLVLLVLGLAGWRRALVSGVWKIGVGIGTAIPVVIVLAMLWVVPEWVNKKYCGVVVVLSLAYAAALISANMKPRWAPAIQTALAAVFVVELMIFALPALTLRGLVADDGSSPAGSYTDGTQSALALVRARETPDSFYRIEKTYYSVYLNDAMAQNYAGTQSYYFHASSITRFIDRMQIKRPIPHSNYISAPMDRPDLLDLLAVKYLLARDRGPDNMPGMELVDSADGINVYRNSDARAFGAFYDEAADETTADRLAVPARDKLLLTKVVVADASTLQTVRSALDSSTANSSIANGDIDLHKLRDDQFTGTLQTSRSRILLLAMPFDRGWHAQLNGNDVALFRADYGLTAMLVPSGRHAIALHYVPPGRVPGWWLSTSVLILLGLDALRRLLRNRRS